MARHKGNKHVTFHGWKHGVCHIIWLGIMLYTTNNAFITNIQAYNVKVFSFLKVKQIFKPYLCTLLQRLIASPKVQPWSNHVAMLWQTFKFCTWFFFHVFFKCGTYWLFSTKRTYKHVSWFIYFLNGGKKILYNLVFFLNSYNNYVLLV